MLSQYLLTILAIAIFSVMIDLVLPVGEMSKYIKGVFVFVFIFVVLSPIPKLLNFDFSFQNLIETSKATEIDNNFLNSENSFQKQKLTDDIVDLLNKNGFKDVDVLLTTKNEGYLEVLDKVHIDLTNLVLKNENQHINKYTTIKDLLTKNTQITEEQIVFYG